MHTYYRIDQEELEKRGMAHKSELEKGQGGLGNMYQFSMLQRFRQQRDFRAPDKYKPRVVDEDTDYKSRENEWFKQNVQTEQ